MESEIVPLGINELSLLFTKDKDIAEINSQYRSKNKPTDVLSFPTYSRAELLGKKKSPTLLDPSLGDIVISVPTSIKQAKKYGVTLNEEYLRLLIHGILHLCGYDHEKVSKNEAARMRRKERALMTKLN